MNALRSSAVNSVFSLRIGLLTTPTTTRSKTFGGAGDDVDVAVGDRVVAARADDGAVCARSLIARAPRRWRRRRRRSGAGAARSQRVDAQRPAGAALDDRPPALGEQAGQMGVEFLPHAVGESIGGIDEDEVEARPPRRLRDRPPASARRRRGPARRARRGRAARRCRAPARVSRSTRTARGGAARERLDRQRAGAAVEVEDAGALDRARRAPRRSPRGRGRRSAAPSSRAARPGAAPSALRRSPSSRLGSSHQSARIGSAAPAPKRRRAASSSGPSAGASSEPWRAQQRQHLLAGRDQRSACPRAARRRRSAAGRAGGCRGSRPRRAG